MRGLFVLILVGLLNPTGSALAQSLIPGPGEPDFDPQLAEKADRFSIQLHELLTPPIGFSLDARISDPEAIAVIDAFFESGERDFQAFSGKHIYELVDSYEDYWHATIFGGAQMAGDAFRYAVLRDEGGPTEAVQIARAAFIKNLDALDWITRITGEPGVVARGLRRITPEPGEPPLPGDIPETVPLFDDSGDPQPRYKEPTWRADQSGELPFLIWIDDASRDTMDGYIFALGAAYDVGVDDPDIPQEKIARLVEHARAIGLRLLEKVDVGADDKIDLVIRDADGRPTRYHALSAEELIEGVVSVEAASGFNAIMSIGMLRTLYHISGEPKLWKRYREMVQRRGFLEVAERSLADVLYFKELTNYSGVNMIFIAFYGALRYENDPVVSARLRGILEDQAYAPGEPREPRGLGMSFFDFIYAGFRTGGIGGTGSNEGPGAQALLEGIETLRGHPAPPHWDRLIANCDDAEIESRDCELLDGTVVRLSERRGYGGDRVVAEVPIPMPIRPPSNYTWRSDPHGVNGGGIDRLNSGGDFYVAYWMGRFLKTGDQPLQNVSPIARGEPPEGVPDGCGCSSAEERGSQGRASFFFALMALTILSIFRSDRRASLRRCYQRAHRRNRSPS